MVHKEQLLWSKMKEKKPGMAQELITYASMLTLHLVPVYSPKKLISKAVSTTPMDKY
jgi:hypothetical protein